MLHIAKTVETPLPPPRLCAAWGCNWPWTTSAKEHNTVGCAIWIRDEWMIRVCHCLIHLFVSPICKTWRVRYEVKVGFQSGSFLAPDLTQSADLMMSYTPGTTIVKSTCVWQLAISITGRRENSNFDLKFNFQYLLHRKTIWLIYDHHSWSESWLLLFQQVLDHTGLRFYDHRCHTMHDRGGQCKWQQDVERPQKSMQIIQKKTCAGNAIAKPRQVLKSKAAD